MVDRKWVELIQGGSGTDSATPSNFLSVSAVVYSAATITTTKHFWYTRFGLKHIRHSELFNFFYKLYLCSFLFSGVEQNTHNTKKFNYVRENYHIK